MANKPIKEVVVNGNTYPIEADTSEIKDQLTAEDDLQFQFSKSGSNYGYKDANGNFVPFKNPTGTKSITANGTYDVTDYASAKVNVSTSAVYLGTITGDGTMNIKTKYPNEYASFTSSSFICERSSGGANNYGGVGYNYLVVPTFSKSYSQSTGILNVSGNYAGIGLGSSVYQSISTTVKVYLVK